MYDAIVLAGGAARRLGGAAKPQLEVDGVRLLDRVVSAVSGASRVVVVGPPQPVTRPVVWAQEQPPGGGPVAALGAGAAVVGAPVVLTLAADLPSIAGGVPALLAAVPADGMAVLVDGGSRRNYLAAAWRTASLRAALDRLGPVSGASMRALVALADTVVDVVDPDGWGHDCDTWADLARARSNGPQEAR